MRSNRNIIKTLTAAVTLLVILTALPLSVSALGTFAGSGEPTVIESENRNRITIETDEDEAGLTDGRLVHDVAGVLSDGDEAELEQLLAEIGEKNSITVAAAFLNNYDGYSIARFAADYYEENDYGVGDERDGVLFTVSFAESDWDICTSGKCQNAFTESVLYDFENSVVGYLSSGDYAQAVREYASFCDDTMTSYGKLPIGGIIIGSLVVGFIIALITVSAMKAKLKSVRAQNYASNYVRADSLNLRESSDRFLYSHTTRTEKPKDDDDDHRSGSRSSSSGHSYGGRSGKF